jgi:hypothetical protein
LPAAPAGPVAAQSVNLLTIPLLHKLV